jgi:hypothetical protein
MESTWFTTVFKKIILRINHLCFCVIRNQLLNVRSIVKVPEPMGKLEPGNVKLMRTEAANLILAQCLTTKYGRDWPTSDRKQFL